MRIPYLRPFAGISPISPTAHALAQFPVQKIPPDAPKRTIRSSESNRPDYSVAAVRPSPLAALPESSAPRSGIDILAPHGFAPTHPRSQDAARAAAPRRSETLPAIPTSCLMIARPETDGTLPLPRRSRCGGTPAHLSREEHRKGVCTHG